MHYQLKDLSILVHSMTGAEKRHFSLMSAAFQSSEEPVYLQLFRVLLKPETELSEFAAKHGNEVIYSAKKRLLENILRSLRSFHQNQSVDIRIQNHLSDIEVLFSRGLPHQSFYVLQKALKLTAVYEKFRLQLQILEWERKLHILLDKPSRTIREISIEEEDVLQKLMQIVHLENIYSKAKDMKKLYGSIKGEKKAELIQITVNAPNMIQPEQCLSQSARFYYNFIHTLFNWMTYNHKKAYQFSKELLRPETGIILPGDYIEGILEHVTSCIHIGKFEEAIEGLKLVSEKAEEHHLSLVPAVSTKLFFYKSGYHLVIYNYMGAWKMLCNSIKVLEEEIEIYEPYMPFEARQVLFANLMNAYVGAGEFDKAEIMWDRLFHKTSKTIRRDIYDDLFLFRLFMLLQRGLYVLLPSMALSAQRNYKQSESPEIYFNVELKITSLLLKEWNYENKNTRKELLFQVKEIITRYINQLEGTNDFQEHYSFYVLWAQSILEQQPYHEVAARWFNSFEGGR